MSLIWLYISLSAPLPETRIFLISTLDLEPWYLWYRPHILFCIYGILIHSSLPSTSLNGAFFPPTIQVRFSSSCLLLLFHSIVSIFIFCSIQEFKRLYNWGHREDEECFFFRPRVHQQGETISISPSLFPPLETTCRCCLWSTSPLSEATPRSTTLWMHLLSG